MAFDFKSPEEFADFMLVFGATAKREEIVEAVTPLFEVLRQARAVIEENHQWHQEYDDYDGYPDSHLCEVNTAALRSLSDVWRHSVSVKETLNTLESWLVCHCIASAEDMAQSFPEMLELVSLAKQRAS